MPSPNSDKEIRFVFTRRCPSVVGHLSLVAGLCRPEDRRGRDDALIDARHLTAGVQLPQEARERSTMEPAPAAAAPVPPPAMPPLSDAQRPASPASPTSPTGFGFGDRCTAAARQLALSILPMGLQALFRQSFLAVHGHEWQDEARYGHFLIHGGVPPWAPFDQRLPGHAIVATAMSSKIGTTESLVGHAFKGDQLELGAGCVLVQLKKDPQPPPTMPKTGDVVPGKRAYIILTERLDPGIAAGEHLLQKQSAPKVDPAAMLKSGRTLDVKSRKKIRTGDSKKWDTSVLRLVLIGLRHTGLDDTLLACATREAHGQPSRASPMTKAVEDVVNGCRNIVAHEVDITEKQYAEMIELLVRFQQVCIPEDELFRQAVEMHQQRKTAQSEAEERALRMEAQALRIRHGITGSDEFIDIADTTRELIGAADDTNQRLFAPLLVRLMMCMEQMGKASPELATTAMSLKALTESHIRRKTTANVSAQHTAQYTQLSKRVACLDAQSTPALEDEDTHAEAALLVASEDVEYLRKDNGDKIELGSGAFGYVYHAKLHGNDVAAKLIKRRGSDGSDDNARYRQEASIIFSLSHPNVARFNGISDYDGTPVLLFELLKYDLGRIIHHSDPDDEMGTFAESIEFREPGFATKARIMVEVAEAMAYLHGHQPNAVIHRDLKPSNVMLDDGGVCKLIDFGLAKAVDAKSLASATRTQLGSPVYMAPEIEKTGRYSGKVDQYAYAISMWELWTEQRPKRPSQQELGTPTGEPLDVGQLRWSGAPPQAVDTIRQCWRIESSERPEFTLVLDCLRPKETPPAALINHGNEAPDDEQLPLNARPAADPPLLEDEGVADGSTTGLQQRPPMMATTMPQKDLTEDVSSKTQPGQPFSVPFAGEYPHTKWVDDPCTVKKCQCCKKKTFGLTSWQHHCRFCGKVVCHGCSKEKKPYGPTGRGERCCTACLQERPGGSGTATFTCLVEHLFGQGECPVCEAIRKSPHDSGTRSGLFGFGPNDIAGTNGRAARKGTQAAEDLKTALRERPYLVNAVATNLGQVRLSSSRSSSK